MNAISVGEPGFRTPVRREKVGDDIVAADTRVVVEEARLAYTEPR
jgi:hypothetical protein